MKIEDLNLSVRTYNTLKRAGIDTVEELRLLRDMELTCLRGLGKHSLEEIRGKIGNYAETNGDRIRAMTDEELAEVINRVPRPCPYCQLSYIAGACTESLCDDARTKWLRQPAEVRELCGK